MAELPELIAHALESQSLLNSSRMLADWHDDHHPGAYEVCHEQPCRLGDVEAWHYDQGHPYAADLCDDPLCWAYARRAAIAIDPARRVLAGRLPHPLPAVRKLPTNSLPSKRRRARRKKGQ